MDPLLLVAAAVTLILSVARVARLVTADAYPPAVAVRVWWLNHVPDRWGPLLTCPFCAAPYIALVAVAWTAAVLPGDPTDVWSAAWWWWFLHGWSAVSYVAAMIVVRDEPPEE